MKKPVRVLSLILAGLFIFGVLFVVIFSVLNA